MMRLSYFVAWVGLAGLVVTSPTPNDAGMTAVIDVVASSQPSRLVAYTLDEFQGPSYEVALAKINGHCYNFESPVYENLRSYMVSNMACSFIDGNDCVGNVLVQADAIGTEVWGRVDVGGVNGHARMMRSVHCSDSVSEATPRKRSEDVASRIMDGPGEAIVCEDTLENGRCETLSANYACVALPPGLSRNVKTIYQSAGAVCNYYSTACSVPTPFLSINSRTKAVRVALEDRFRESISLVQCEAYTNAVESDPNSLRKRSEVAVAAKNFSKDTTRNRGDIMICEAVNFEKCGRIINAMGRCLNFPMADGPDSFKQFAGVFCKWYEGYDCQTPEDAGGLLLVDSTLQVRAFPDLLQLRSKMKSVTCLGQPF